MRITPTKEEEKRSAICIPQSEHRVACDHKNWGFKGSGNGSRQQTKRPNKLSNAIRERRPGYKKAQSSFDFKRVVPHFMAPALRPPKGKNYYHDPTEKTQK